MQEIPSITSNQEETDTRVILYIQYAESLGFPSVVVRTPDSDIFFILLFHASSFNIVIYIDIGMGKNRKLINISALAEEMGKDWCSVLLSLYVFTGEDCTSAFKGKGKVTPLKKLMKTPRFHASFRYHIFVFIVNFLSLQYIISSVGPFLIVKFLLIHITHRNQGYK